jgi:GT2 family glycosyltransferase
VLSQLAEVVGDRNDATLIALDRNMGVGGGRNVGASLGHGQIIASLDNDAEFATADTLRHLVSTLRRDPSLGVVACRIVLHASGDDDLSSWGYPLGLLPLATKSFDTATFVGAGHAIRRTAWDQAGGYDATLFFCWEEYDFALRASACGWRIRYRGDLVVRHKVAEERRVGWSDRRWFYFVRNRLYIGRKYGVGWLALTPRVLGYFIKGMRNGLPATTVRAILEACAMAPAVPVRRLAKSAWAGEAGYRGSWLNRLRREVFAALPRAR